jgi:NADPH-dependent ferric siderophore reductase
MDDVQLQMFGHLAAARAADPDGELTSMEREMAQQDAIPTRVVTVTAVADVAPGIRQITVGGIRGHVPLGPDDFFLMILPREGLEHQLDGTLVFADFMALPEDEKPGWAYYTCRRFRPETGEMDLWFVLHDHDGAVSGWARHAEVGDRLAMWGPREAFEPPADATSYLLVGDETGLGAFAAILDAADGGPPVHVVVESTDGTPVLDLPARAKDTVQWVSRDGAAHGEGTALVAAVAALALDTTRLYAYGAAESREVTAVRKHLRRTLGMPAVQVQMVGYWRREI